MEQSTRTWVGSTRTRTKIIEATARMVLTHGLRAMTVQHILDDASVSRRTFYQHFRSKEEAAASLYRSVSRELIREVHTAMKATKGLRERLHAGVDAYVRFHRQVGDLATLLRAEAVDPGSILAPQREENLTVLARLIGNEVEEVTSRAPDPLLMRALILGLEGLCTFHRDHGELTAPAFPLVTTAAKALFDSILATGAAGPKEPTPG